MNDLIFIITQQIFEKLLRRQLVIEAIKRNDQPDLAVSDLDPGGVVQLMVFNNGHQLPAKENRATLAARLS